MSSDDSPDALTLGNSTDSADAGPSVDVDGLVLHVELILFALFALFCLLTLPRMFAVLGRSTHFFSTMFLRAPPPGEPVPPLKRDFGPFRQGLQFNPNGNMSAFTLNDPNTPDAHARLLTGSKRSAKTPPRVPYISTLTHPFIVAVLNYQLFPGLTLLKFIAMLIMFGFLCYAGFYYSDPFTDPARSGDICSLLIPIVVGLACKNNVLSWLSGIGYEKFNYIHRFAGYMILIAANLHGVGFVYQWASQGTVYTNLLQYLSGVAALAGFDIVFLGSREFIRKKSYTVFLITHIGGFAIASAGALAHMDQTIPYFLGAVGLYGVDYILRLVRARTVTAYLTPISSLNGGTTHVHIPTLTRGFRPGQHVRVRIVGGKGFATKLWALVGILRSRPLSISSRPNGSGLELLVKNEHGPFTSRLFQLANAAGIKMQGEAKDAGEVEAGLPTGEVQLMIDGPYGGPTYTYFEAYSGVLLLAGGSGISSVLSILDDLIAKHAAGTSRVRVIDLVWSVGDPASLVSLLPTLRPLMRVYPFNNVNLEVRITVHCTRGSAPKGLGATLPEGMQLKSGRVNAQRAVEDTIDLVLATSPGERANGVVAVSCGPPALSEQLRASIGCVSSTRWRSVGGVEGVFESFDF